MLRHGGNFDVIHAHFGPYGHVLSILRDKGLVHGALVTSFHGYDVTVVPKRYGAHCYDHLFAVGDCFTYSSSYVHDRLLALGAPVNMLKQLRVGVDTKKYSFQPRQKPIDGLIRLVTVARLVEVKGHEYLLRALPEILGNHPGVQYEIVGDGPLSGQLQELSRQLGVSEHVKFHGFLTQGEVIEILGDCHVFVLPGIEDRTGQQEAQGLVLIEAQASGMPVISSNMGGVKESISNGCSGFLVPQKDIHALARAIIDLIDHAEVWRKMGECGRQFVAQHFDLDRLTDQLLSIYRECGV